MGVIEKVLFDYFPKMPKGVRVIVYLVFLLLFAYLVLLPRFVDGQLVVRESTTGGMLPYRGADLQIQVDGRPYKFKSNEDGFFSIPVISHFPTGLEIEIYHADKNLWFPVELSVADIWSVSNHNHRIEVLADQPFMRLTEAARETHEEHMLAKMFQWLVSSADAQAISLPNTARFASAQLSNTDKAVVQTQVQQAYENVVGKTANQVGLDAPLAGSGGLTYVQRIQLVTALEKTFGFKIPDEHWQQMTNVGQLVDYVQKRKQLQRALPAQTKASTNNWAHIQQSFPVDSRPVYSK